MPPAWYQHQTRGPASGRLKLKGFLSSGTCREFKFSCRGAAGTQNSRNNKECSPLIESCHLIGGNPGACLTLTEAAAGSCVTLDGCPGFLYSSQTHKSKKVQMDLRPFLCFLRAPRVWLKPDAETSSAQVTGARQRAWPDAWSARCRCPDLGSHEKPGWAHLGEMLMWKTRVQRMVHHCYEKHEAGWSRGRCGKVHQGSSSLDRWEENKRIMCN